MRGKRVRQWVIAAFVACGAGCSDPCEEVAASVRACCAKGPAELAHACEARAASLENDGHQEACDQALARGDFARCDL
jgi:hypothetical protein